MQNTFFQHGFEADDATVLALKSDVARAIRGSIGNQAQSAAARRLHIAQSDLSKIVRGNLAAISLERLIKITVRLKLEMSAQWGGDPHQACAVASVEQPGVLELHKHSDSTFYVSTAAANLVGEAPL